MKSVCQQLFNVTDTETDRYGRLKPSAILHFAQQAAQTHCLQLGTDWETLSKRNLFWAVLRHRVQVSRLPSVGETVTVHTWPMPTTRSAFPRATAAYDAQGNELFRIISLWVRMDAESRNMVLPGKSGIAVAGTVCGNELAVPGSIVPKPLSTIVPRQVGFSELDRNGHMNNTRYLDWIMDLLPSEFHAAHPVREFTVCYLSEALEKQQIDLHWQLDSDGLLQAEGYRTRQSEPEKSERVFASHVLF